MEYWWIILIVLLGGAAIAVEMTRRRSRTDGTAMEVYIEGLRSMIAGDQRTAFVKFRQAVDLDTENIDAYLKLGDLFRKSGQVEKALQIHRELMLRHDIKSELQGDIRRSLAQDYIESKLNDKASDILKQMIKGGENRVWAEDRLLELYIKSEDWEKSEELYRGIMKSRALKESPIMSNIKLMIGRRLHDESQFHKARLQYKEALSMNGSDPFPYIYIAESYIQEDRINDGLEFLKKLCENVPDRAYLGFSMIEETLFSLGRFGEVEDIYRSLLAKDSQNIPATIALAGILEKKGEISSAESLLRTAFESGKSEIAALRLARLLADTDRLEEGMGIVSEMAGKIKTDHKGFACRKCGNIVQTPSPFCKACGSLGSYI